MNISDPYRNKMFKSDPYFAKSVLTGKLVVVWTANIGAWPQFDSPAFRAICRYQVHELIMTDQDARPGDTVNPIAYLGFVEFQQGGVMVAGDRVVVDGEDIGFVCGFDETHMPNHLNIVVQGERVTGRQRNLSLGQQIEFVKNAGQLPARK